ncbi:MAG TPA: phosphopantothenoylcysteine decarboxylase [Tepidisphaeraceae bacterium]|jgi:phosphopantothenate-cysteine ligase|nr:phosphopantothenoylcysteine decarboxylase [Tepidisphaeraceae bacterium]
MRCLVTAGNTRERIDSVRDWGNIFTGNTGLSIAQSLAHIATVDLLTSNRQHITLLESTPSIHASPFTTHQELVGSLDALLARTQYNAIFMTAAVSDYKPVSTYAVLSRTPHADAQQETWQVQNVQQGKIKSTHKEIAILGQPTEKIIDLFRPRWHHKGLLIKFKLEVGISKDELLKIADASRRASQADYLVANTLEMVEGGNAGAYLLSDSAAPEWIPRTQLAARMCEIVASNNSTAH